RDVFSKFLVAFCCLPLFRSSVMKSFMMLFAVLVALAAVPAVAGDRQVPQSTLRALGLGGMQVATDAQGMQVRGRQSALVSVKGRSEGRRVGKESKNWVVRSSVNEEDASGTRPGTDTTATKAHAGVPSFKLTVNIRTLTATQ